MKNHIAIWSRVLALTLLGSSASAQVPPSVEQAETLKRRQETQQMQDKVRTGESAPILSPEEMIDVGPQSILRMKRRQTWFEASADSQLLYTSNILLTEGNSPFNRGTSFLVSGVSAALAPQPFQLGNGLFAPRVGVRHQWFNYGIGDGSLERDLAISNPDFDAQAAFADARYRFAENWIADAGVDALRILNHTPSYDSYQETYKEVGLRWGLLRQFPFTETRLLALGYEGSHHFGSTRGAFLGSSSDRSEHSALLAYTHALTPQLVMQPYYRFLYTWYTRGASRNDYLNSVGLSLSYYFTSWCSARCFVAYDFKESDNALVADYRKFDGGAGLNLTFRF